MWASQWTSQGDSPGCTTRDISARLACWRSMVTPRRMPGASARSTDCSRQYTRPPIVEGVGFARTAAFPYSATCAKSTRTYGENCRYYRRWKIRVLRGLSMVVHSRKLSKRWTTTTTYSDYSNTLKIKCLMCCRFSRINLRVSKCDVMFALQ